MDIQVLLRCVLIKVMRMEKHVGYGLVIRMVNLLEQWVLEPLLDISVSMLLKNKKEIKNNGE